MKIIRGLGGFFKRVLTLGGLVGAVIAAGAVLIVVGVLLSRPGYPGAAAERDLFYGIL